MENRSMPPGMLIPELLYDDMPAAVAWLCATFGFTERLRIDTHRTQMLINTGRRLWPCSAPLALPPSAPRRAAP